MSEAQLNSEIALVKGGTFLSIKLPKPARKIKILIAKSGYFY